MSRQERRTRENQKCACGSGNKYKNCCRGKQSGGPLNRNPRTTFVQFDMGLPVAAKDYRISRDEDGIIKVAYMKDGEIIKPQSARWSATYDRSKGQKVLVDVPIVGDDATMDMVKLLTRFDLIYAVDTNTREIDGKQVSIGILVLCKKAEPAEENQGYVNFDYGIIH